VVAKKRIWGRRNEKSGRESLQAAFTIQLTHSQRFVGGVNLGVLGKNEELLGGRNGEKGTGFKAPEVPVGLIREQRMREVKHSTEGKGGRGTTNRW